jgi:hypothetical protein
LLACVIHPDITGVNGAGSQSRLPTGEDTTDMPIFDKYSVTVIVETTDPLMAADIQRALRTAVDDVAVGDVTVYAGDLVAVRRKETKLEKYVRLFNAGAIDKFEFFSATMNYSAKLVAELSGIDHGVVLDRKRYMRQLAAQAK